ncbi:MAG: hypothetical protein M0P26_05060 [Bacteroidales bacterium]|jgi:hypothetical protein|nr:hypothetical protein [Bacteroidales bacterium]
MKELNAGSMKFFNRWKEQRTKKWQYAFLHGSIYWGLPIAIILFLINSHFKVDQMQLSKLITYIIVFLAGGFFSGLLEFKRFDKVYQNLRDDESIEYGIVILKSGKVWNHENLKIQILDEKILLIKNELFWFEDSDVSVDKINECFNLVLSDFQRLKMNSAFNEFTKMFDVRLQIFDNSGSINPLIDKII